jgi:hypothetical protein
LDLLIVDSKEEFKSALRKIILKVLFKISDQRKWASLLNRCWGINCLPSKLDLKERW